MQTTRRTFVAGALAGFATVQSTSAFSQDVSRRKTLKVIAHADLKILDPIWTSAAITLEHAYLVYDKLFELDRSGRPRPQMADRHDVSGDGLEHTIVLRDGLRFHDGTDVTSADVVPSLVRWGKRSAMGVKLMQLAVAIEAVDPKTIRIKLKSPFPDLTTALSSIRGNPAFIMQAKVAATEPTEQIKTAIGSGPYVFRADLWKPGSRFVYEKAPTYVPRSEPTDGYAGAKSALADRIEFLYLPDVNTAFNALQSGDMDIWELMPSDYVSLVAKSPNLVPVQGMLAYGYYGINHLHPPFDNPKIRQALLYLINQKEVLTAITGGPDFFKTCPSFFSCPGPYGQSVEGDALLKVDIDKAKQLLKEGGYDGRPVVILDTTDIAALHTPSLYIAQQLRKAGINVDLQAVDWSTTISRIPLKNPPQEGGWNIYATYSSATEAASPFVSNIIGGPAANQPGWPVNKRIDELIGRWMLTDGEDERLAIVHQILAEAGQSVPFIPWGQFYSARARRKSVKGHYGEAPVPIYWGVSLEG